MYIAITDPTIIITDPTTIHSSLSSSLLFASIQIGVVAYALLCGYEPFYGDTETQLMESNRIVNYAFHSPEWDHISNDAKDFIKKCFHQR